MIGHLKLDHQVKRVKFQADYGPPLDIRWSIWPHMWMKMIYGITESIFSTLLKVWHWQTPTHFTLTVHLQYIQMTVQLVCLQSNDCWHYISKDYFLNDKEEDVNGACSKSYAIYYFQDQQKRKNVRENEIKRIKCIRIGSSVWWDERGCGHLSSRRHGTRRQYCVVLCVVLESDLHSCVARRFTHLNHGGMAVVPWKIP